MTEAEWLTSDDPVNMLNVLRGKPSDRSLRLYGCACCRHIWPALIHEWSRTAVEVAEQYADGFATVEQLQRAWPYAQVAWKRARDPDDPDNGTDNPFRTAPPAIGDYVPVHREPANAGGYSAPRGAATRPRRRADGR